VVRAAGRAGAESGSAVNIHLDPFPTDALRILDALVAEGMSPERVIFSHMDEHLDLAYHRDVAQAGAVLEYDTFGAEFYWGDFHRDPSDLERIEHLLALLSEGYGDRITLGCDVWIKATLRSYGGDGYAHLPGTIVPVLRDRFGVDQGTLDLMLTGTPARLLDRP
ncbi:MAG: phosphotriesterase, partial [Actinobacteria bacterium]|nr:phosphotriesterase [Actinomycetota bacterium]